MVPDGIRSQERLCWRGSASIYWTGPSRRSRWRLSDIFTSPVGLGTKEQCVSEAQQQFSSQRVSESVTQSVSEFSVELLAAAA
jgi:hypothetical protein